MASGNGNGYDASFTYAGGYSAGYSGYNDSMGSTASSTSTAAVPTSPQQRHSPQQLRRRVAEMDPLNGAGYKQSDDGFGYGSPSSSQRGISSRKEVVQKLDFMFTKVDREYTVRTERGGMASLIAYGLIVVLVVAESLNWFHGNYRQSSVEHITVDTSLGKRMRVNLDITFPSLACEDLHVDIMDVAGDSQLDVVDTMIKKRLNNRGNVMGKEEMVETNAHQLKQQKKNQVISQPVPDDYCGPCYGAHETENQCCNTCDDLLEAYKTKRWRTDLVVQTAEQCIREGRDKATPKRMRRGEGCNLFGHFMVNRVGGNFHIAMGEGIERDGRHIHTFNPDDTHNFNASHVINHLSFGPPEPEKSRGRRNSELTSLNGVRKIVTKEYGTTGLFQYFIKIVPTTYKSAGPDNADLETNRYFYTERFRPLMREYFDDDDLSLQDAPDDDTDGSKKLASVEAGHVGGHAHHAHHNVKKNSLLPGVFFIYEIYPFEVEISISSVPLTHLLIRIMATVGGVFTIVRWFDALWFTRDKRRSSHL